MRRSCGCARSRPRCRLVRRLSALCEVASPARSAGRRSRGSARNPGSRPWRLARARSPRWRCGSDAISVVRVVRDTWSPTAPGRVGAASCAPCTSSPPTSVPSRTCSGLPQAILTLRIRATLVPCSVGGRRPCEPDHCGRQRSPQARPDARDHGEHLRQCSSPGIPGVLCRRGGAPQAGDRTPVVPVEDGDERTRLRDMDARRAS